MSLSVCLIASAPAARVAALLEPLRALADEIVLAVDSRVDAASVARFAALADRCSDRVPALGAPSAVAPRPVRRRLDPAARRRRSAERRVRARLPELLASRSNSSTGSRGHGCIPTRARAGRASLVGRFQQSARSQRWAPSASAACSTRTRPAHPAATSRSRSTISRCCPGAEARSAKAIRYEVLARTGRARRGPRERGVLPAGAPRRFGRGRCPARIEPRSSAPSRAARAPRGGGPRRPVVSLEEIDRHWDRPRRFRRRLRITIELYRRDRLPPERTETVLSWVHNLGTEPVPGASAASPPSACLSLAPARRLRARPRRRTHVSPATSARRAASCR